MTDMTPEQLDQWRMRSAESAVHAKQCANKVEGYSGYLGPIARECALLEEYRRLVREDVRPPAEPDQDTLDARAVLGAWHDDCMPHEPTIASDLRDGLWDGDDSFRAAFHALAAIKARVRREAIQALPDVPTDHLKILAEKTRASRNTLAPIPMGIDWLVAIKQVYGKDT